MADDQQPFDDEVFNCCPICMTILEYALDVNDGRGKCPHCGYEEMSS